MPSEAPSPLLAAKGISQRFSPNVALRNAAFPVLLPYTLPEAASGKLGCGRRRRVSFFDEYTVTPAP